MFNKPQQITEPITFQQSFLSKVFFFFGLAIAISALGAYVGLNYFAQYFLANPALIYLAFALELILVFTSKAWSQKRPLNVILFTLFAFSTGVTLVPMLAFLSGSGSMDLVLKAFIATTLMFTATAIFGFFTNINLQGLRGFLFVALLGMIIVSVLGIFLPWGSTFEMIFSGFGVILFSAYTAYDIQRLKSYPENMYIEAALQLYLDIFNLFLYILRLITAFSRD